jgi:hypothetical protein
MPDEPARVAVYSTRSIAGWIIRKFVGQTPPPG